MSHPSEGAIGVDIGGTKIAVAAVASSGVILARRVFPTEAGQGFDRAVDRIGDAIEEALAEAPDLREGCAGIGIGCAGPVDPLRGLINNPYTLSGWDRCDLVTPLSSRFQMPVRLENDADVAAVGECAFGAGVGADTVAMLTFGTGVGGAVILHGEIYRGAQGEHPELGHMVVAAEGPDCYCGTRGCLESLASGTAVGQAGAAHGFKRASAVFLAAERGDALAQPLAERALQAVATAAWNLAHSFLPDRIVLGGGLMEDAFEPFARAIRQRLARATQFTPGNVSIVHATMENDAGLVGAASLMFRRPAHTAL